MNDETSGPELWTREQAAERLGVTVRTVARYIENGDLRAYRIGPRRVRIRPADVEAMAREITPHGNAHGVGRA